MNKMPVVYILDENEENLSFVYPPKNYKKDIINKIKKYKNELVIISTTVCLIGLAVIKQKIKK